LKLLLIFIMGIVLGALITSVPLGYRLEQAIEEKASAVNVMNNLVHSEPAAFESACQQREWTAKTTAVTEQEPAPVQPSAPPEAESILTALLRLLFR